MKKRVRQAVVRVAILREEYAWDEIDEAIEYVRRHDVSARLTRYIAEGDSSQEGGTAGGPPRAKKVDMPALPSEAVGQLAHADYASFALFSRFERMLWERQILPKLSDLRAFGKAIHPGFAPRTTQEALRELVALALKYPTETVKQMIEKVITGKPWDELEDESLVHLTLGRSGGGM